MTVQALQENLTKTIAKAIRVVPNRPPLPVLQNILIETDDGMLRITGTDMETTISALSGAKIEKEGSCLVPAKLFLDLVSSLPQETVTLNMSGASLSVTTSKTKAVIPTTSAAEFPSVRIKPSDKPKKVDAALFSKALQKVLFAAATDDGRPVLAGVRFASQNESPVLVATDGYRLSVEPLDSIKVSGWDMIVPARALGELVRLIAEEKPTDIFFHEEADGQALFTVGETHLVTRLIDGEYPPYERIIPKTSNTISEIHTEEFLRAVKSASIFAKDSANIIRLDITEDVVRVQANTPQVGENSIEVEAATKGDGGQIAFNSRFLIDFLSGPAADTVVFEMTGSLNPGVFKNKGEEGYLHIIMPVRVQG